MYDRRNFIVQLSLGAVATIAWSPRLSASPLRGRRTESPFSPAGGPRARVLFANDLSGDVDGLFALAHLALSPSVDLRGVIAGGTVENAADAKAAAAEAIQLLRIMKLDKKIPVHVGAMEKLPESGAVRSAGTQAIIDEAMRMDTTLPLYIASGGGLTEVASALILEPAIASRFTLIWIGGRDFPGRGGPEINMAIDPRSVRYVFNQSTVPIWLVPLNVYATCVVPVSTLQLSVAPFGPLGSWLYSKLVASNKRLAGAHINSGETWTLGDSPLVTLTALTDAVASSPRASRYESTGASPFRKIPTPVMERGGTYQQNDAGRPMRVYTGIDMQMTMNDFYAKMALHAAK